MNTKFRNAILTMAMVVLIGAISWATATNYVQPGDVITLTWSTASPALNGACIKCTTKATGGIIGVAVSATGTADEDVQVATKGVYDLSVTASSTVGSIAIGDYIFAAVDGINTGTTTLSNINTGLLFGQALEAVTASTTAGVYSTINVKLLQPSHL